MCLIQLMHVLTTRARAGGEGEGGGLTAALTYKKGHASAATPTVNKSGHDSGLS